MSILAKLSRAAARVPELLREVSANDRSLPPAGLLRENPVISTGIGLAGGPARLFASCAAALGCRARFVPLSNVVGASPEAETLVLFSQSLSPNARLARRISSRETVVFTGVDPELEEPGSLALREVLRGGRSVPVPSREAHGRMVRLHSPQTSAFAALRWLGKAFPEAGWVSRLNDVPTAVEAAIANEREKDSASFDEPVVLVSAGRDPTELHQLAWKWAETVFAGPPLIVDALELAHGPLQAFFENRMTVLGLEEPGYEPLFERVRAVLEPSRHVYRTLAAGLPAPLSLFEHDARLNEILLRQLEAQPERLDAWPGKGRDRPLYGFSG